MIQKHNTPTQNFQMEQEATKPYIQQLRQKYMAQKITQDQITTWTPPENHTTPPKTKTNKTEPNRNKTTKPTTSRNQENESQENIYKETNASK